ncbi:nucleotide-sugar transporter [Coniochaeta ligniaria NRRL 30616]|uniref:Nucleotide-sugar transporter n=1 Tax=Coniochaeta ligniaria NRRL 30616 TaxID=1408157 RepID=A0A1J7JCR9_9PEZI|nr:nucleotide-sugar transporter [Coniochaeta ligniaria NRRL 30616]
MALLDAPPAAGSSFFGMPMKQVSLITLTFQNSALILIMHYSRIMPPQGDHRYFASTAVFLAEVLKLAVALTFAIYEVSRNLAPQTPATVIFQQISNSVFSGDGWKLVIPATLYTLQNTLQYVALGNLDPVHFQILYELKILTTAFFSVIMLGRSLGSRRWLSLVILTMGVSVVSIPSNSKDLAMVIHDTSDHFFPTSVHELGHMANEVADVAMELTKRAVGGLAGQLTKRSASYEGIMEDQAGAVAMNYSVGLMAVLVAAVVSGLTGVYFEKVLKDSATPVSVWTRNIQLSFYSLFPALIFGVVVNDGAEIARHGFFDGYNWIVWTAIVLQAVGGVLASLVINYADNIAKNFATSISIVISCLFSVWFFDFKVTFPFLAGTALVIASTYLYSGPERRRGRPPPISVVSFEKTTIDRTPRYTDAAKLNADPMDNIKPDSLMPPPTGLTTSRPASPMLHHVRTPSSRAKRFDD